MWLFGEGDVVDADFLEAGGDADLDGVAYRLFRKDRNS